MDRLVWILGRPGASAEREAARITAVHSDTQIDVAGLNPDATAFTLSNVFLDPEHGRHAEPGDLHAEWMDPRAEQFARAAYDDGAHFHGG
jgi:hypothetical protein